MRVQVIQSILLAWRDWKYEKLLSLCSVLALASMLAPILVLQGLKNGVIEGMRSRLLEDPAILIITPKSDAGRFSKEDIDELASLPGARYAVGRTRETSTDITLINPASRKTCSVSFEPASQGEPLLESNNLPAPDSGKEPGVILAAAAAKTLGASVGAALEARLSRKTPEGKFETGKIIFHVAGVLPPEALEGKKALASALVLEDIENFWDFIAAPERGFSGEESSLPRQYASFRLYAKKLDDVEKLTGILEKRNIEVITRAREIAGVRLLEGAINQVIIIISLAVGAGFVAFTFSSVQSSVSRKRKMLGILRLLGFYRFPLMLYPVTQTMLTAAAGFALSLGIYFCVSIAITKSFARQGAIACHMPLTDLLAIGAAVFALSLAACAAAAFKAGNVEPSMVIREV